MGKSISETQIWEFLGIIIRHTNKLKGEDSICKHQILQVCCYGKTQTQIHNATTSISTICNIDVHRVVAWKQDGMLAAMMSQVENTASLFPMLTQSSKADEARYKAWMTLTKQRPLYQALCGRSHKHKNKLFCSATWPSRLKQIYRFHWLPIGLLNSDPLFVI